MATKMIEAMEKSTKAASIDAIGKISLGKYILFTKLALFTTLLDPKEIDVEKKVQGKRALYENMGYGIPSLGILANLEKITVKISIIDKG